MQFDICGETGVKGNIDVLDPLNPYGIIQVRDMDEEDKAEYQEMLNEQTRCQTDQSGDFGNDANASVNISAIIAGGNNSFDASFMAPNNSYTMTNSGPLGGVFMKKSTEEILHFEVPPNSEGKLFEEALALVASLCEDVDLSDIDSLKFHANTWGLSSVKHFAETFVPKMEELKYIDLSDTIGARPRSDLPMSSSAILFEAKDFNIIELNLNDNVLGKEGAKAFSEFLEFNKSLKKLKLRGCALGLPSVEMM